MTTIEINEAIDSHFKSNNGNHWCFEVNGESAYMIFTRMKRVKPQEVALFLLKHYSALNYIMYPGIAFTRETLARAGYFINNQMP